MKALIYLMVIAISSVKFSSAGRIARDVDDIDYYNCTGKPDGDYESPRTYKQFITCHNGRASERDCADCHIDRETCPEGKLCFVEILGRCEWYNNPKCPGHGSGTTPPPITTTPPTAAPTTQKPITDDPTTPEQTTAAPTTSAPGNSCPRNCNQTGWCVDFQRCLEIDGKWQWDEATEWFVGEWKDFTCPGDLVWNPDSTAGPNGSCDEFDNLTPERRKDYKNDPSCWEPCYWKEHETKDGRCSGQYWYANRVDEKNRLLDPPQLKQCPSGLIFNKQLETCTSCEDIVGSTQVECCP